MISQGIYNTTPSPEPLLTNPPLSRLQKESSDTSDTSKSATDLEAGSGASELRVGSTGTAGGGGARADGSDGVSSTGGRHTADNGGGLGDQGGGRGAHGRGGGVVGGHAGGSNGSMRAHGPNKRLDWSTYDRVSVQTYSVTVTVTAAEQVSSAAGY